METAPGQMESGQGTQGSSTNLQKGYVEFRIAEHSLPFRAIWLFPFLFLLIPLQ